MPELDTPQGETVVTAPSEPSATPQATGSQVVQEPAKEQSVKPYADTDVDDPTVLRALIESERKERQKAEMERNQLRNKQDELDKAADEQRKAELTETERLQEELNEFRQREAGREAEEFRQTFLDEHLKDNPTLLKAAKALIKQNPGNLAWGEGMTEVEARESLTSQLDALSEAIGAPIVPDQPSPTVHPNNPAYREAPSFDQVSMIKEARATGDWTKVLQSIPSIQAQSATLGNE